jgi:hypothetical protein
MEEDVYQSSVAADVKDDNVLKQEESNGIKETDNLKGKEKVETNGCQKNSETHPFLIRFTLKINIKSGFIRLS